MSNTRAKTNQKKKMEVDQRLADILSTIRSIYSGFLFCFCFGFFF